MFPFAKRTLPTVKRPPAQCLIRFAEDRDSEVVALIESQNYHPVDEHTLYRRGLAPHAEFLIADYSGRAVGYALYECRRDHVLLHNLVVARSWWRMSVGSQLISEVIERAEELRLPLRVIVPEHNLAGLAFIIEQGFTGRGVRRDWDGSESAWCFEWEAS